MSSNPKQRLFSLQKMNKYFLMPFAIPILCFPTKFFSETMKTDGDKINIKDVSSDNAHTFVFLYQIIQSFSHIFGGLFYFIEKKMTKSKNQNQNIEEQEQNKNNSPINNEDKIPSGDSLVNDTNNESDINIIILVSKNLIEYNEEKPKKITKKVKKF